MEPLLEILKVCNTVPGSGSPDEWEQMIQVDLEAPMRLTHHLAAPMSQREGGGRIINVSSVAGLEPLAGFAAYVAAKHGLTGFSKSSFEVRPNGIRKVQDHISNLSYMLRLLPRCLVYPETQLCVRTPTLVFLRRSVECRS